MDISKTILSDPINKWVFFNAKTEVFLVGGYVRDLLRGHISKDKDFVLGVACGEKNAVESIAIGAAKKFNGTSITLKPQQTFRVVLKKTKEVLDFSCLNLSINNDLKERDFTINAIAWSPETGIIDPFGGRKDLNNHIVKTVRIKNLTEDYLRVIRAYRIAAELGFKIENHIRKYLKRYSKGLATVAPERITEESFKILSNDNPVKYLVECYKDKVLEKILMPRNVNSLSKNIKFLRNFDSFFKTQSFLKSPEGKRITAYLKEEISQGLNRLGLIRLALLLKDGSILNSRLRVSNNINKAIRDIHNGYKEAVKKNSNEELYKIFNAAGNRVFETAIILSFIKGKNIKGVFKKADEFLKIKNKILLNGNDVQKILNIKPGTNIGKILSTLKEQHFKGLIKTKAEARRWLVLNFT